MNQLCDFCREQRSMIYCGADAAYLCLSCDRKVHSANALSKRHSRTLICEGCNSQTAVVRCIEEKLSLCQNCNYSGNYAPDLGIEHKRETINSYSGCPSALELSRVWTFFSTSCNPEAGTVTLDEEAPLPLIYFIEQDAAMDTIESDVEYFDGIESLNTTDQKAASMRIKHLGSVLDESEDEDLDLSDIDWNLENCGALFGETRDDSLEFIDNIGFDGYFETGNFDSVEAEDVARGTSMPSTSIPNAKNKPADSNTSSSKSDHDICFSRPVQSSLSIAVSDESHQDNELPSMVILVAGHPFNMNCPENLLPSAIRDCAVLRYREKKKSRKFDRKVRYASRKAGAEIRKRVKGRFVKAGDPFDYDPLDLTNACAISKVFIETHAV